MKIASVSGDSSLSVSRIAIMNVISKKAPESCGQKIPTELLSSRRICMGERYTGPLLVRGL